MTSESGIQLPPDVEFIPLEGSEQSPENATSRQPPYFAMAHHSSTITVHEAQPLPDPDILLKYQNIQPDFPQRLLAMAEREQNHRHECDRLSLQNKADRIQSDLAARQLKLRNEADRIRSDSAARQLKQSNEYRLMTRGQRFALILGVIVVVLCAYLGYAGHTGYGATVFGFSAAMMGVVIYRNNQGGSPPPRPDSTPPSSPENTPPS
ncbi:MAG: DUF2335 domain-containing protein [Magnetococcales bacterium]|nr:DUF2335 domain-containing protein [Magnetococcales bacterium]